MPGSGWTLRAHCLGLRAVFGRAPAGRCAGSVSRAQHHGPASAKEACQCFGVLSEPPGGEGTALPIRKDPHKTPVRAGLGSDSHFERRKGGHGKRPGVHLAGRPGRGIREAHVRVMTKQRKFFRKALTKLFQAVGRRFTLAAVGKPEWFYESSWTSAQEHQYRKWFEKQGMDDSGWGRRRARNESGWFVLEYGWKVEDDGAKLASKGASARKT